ncbi:lipocalin-like domain-containing protein [Xanthocytophaga flava]|uniref:lipocalin family protein n=1 Tax=Xanthocytophaga flava TaxID=3048013 RepID=UPI0028D1BBDA|nr:lipocalin family protein [Xanthocytophaga flavus]MDJ1470793.1 lipocalin family protein [Xanthocytophaga flavus]
MKTIILSSIIGLVMLTSYAQNPVGKWKLLSHTFFYEGTKMDSHAALISQRPCAAKIVYEINADGTFRLNAAQSGCDEKYRNIQEKLYSKTYWRLEGNKFTTSATNFVVGQSYTISISGNKMTWVGTDGQGTLVYQKL